MSAGNHRKKRPAPSAGSAVIKVQKLSNGHREKSGNEDHSVSALLGLYGNTGSGQGGKNPSRDDNDDDGAKTHSSDTQQPEETTNKTEIQVLVEQLEKARPDSAQATPSPEAFVKSKKRPFQCIVCMRCFIRVDHLKKHALTHSKDKNMFTKSAARPHQCSKCGKCFRRREHLTNHLRIHTGEKPYACSSCDKKFTTKMALNSHSRTHTGEKPYQCRECGTHTTATLVRVMHK